MAVSSHRHTHRATIYISSISTYSKASVFCFLYLFMYIIQQCFICCPLGFHALPEDAGIEPRTVATLALPARRSNHSARSHPLARLDLIHYSSARSHPLARLDLLLQVLLVSFRRRDCWILFQDYGNSETFGE